MKKKICGLLVGLVMMFPVLANAEEVENAIAKIGDKEYATLQEAVDSVTEFDKDNATVIEILRDGENVPGILVKNTAPKNIVVDFKGHTIQFGTPLVGSTGTESQQVHLEKGSIFVFKNGTVKADETAAMIFQIYCDLTIQDMTIDATTSKDDEVWALSLNNGKINILGNTNIYSNDYAFDVFWWPNQGYTDGAQVTVDTTGVVKGMIDVNAHSKADMTKPLSTLVIKNINHEGEFSVLDALKANVTIESGTYTDKETVSELPLETGTDVYEVITLDGKMEYVAANEEDFDEGYFGLGFERESLEQINDDELKETLELVDKALANKYKAAIYYEIVYGPLLNDRIVTDETKYVSKLDKEIDITLEIPEGLEKVKEGYVRKYSVIRVHLNDKDEYETDILSATENKDGTVTFKTDRFSTYVLAYEDVLDVKNADTFDGITSYIILGALSLVALVAVTIIAKKKAFN